MTALPRPNSHPPGIIYEAYSKCLDLEAANSLDAGTDGLTSPVLAARILGYLLREVPTQEGRSSLANEINACRDEVNLRELGHSYLYGFLFPCEDFASAYLIRRLIVSVKRVFIDNGRMHLLYRDYWANEPSSDEWPTLHSGYPDPPSDHDMARKQAFIRDKYRCCITGYYDKAIHKDPNLSQWAKEQEVIPGTMNACHIIPVATNTFHTNENHFSNSDIKRKYTSNNWTILSRFINDENLPRDLNGSKIHSLQNILTMGIDFHQFFDDLTFWLEETNTENQYTVHSHMKGLLRRMPDTIMFTTDTRNYPLPDPKYLRLHATCAKVCHLSGAGKYIESFWRDMDCTQALSTDGSSSSLLASALELVALRCAHVLPAEEESPA